MILKSLAVICMLGIALAIVAFVSGSSSAVTRCQLGKTYGFVSLRSDPPFLVGTIPSSFTSGKEFFEARYNCTGNSARVKRIDTGTYDVEFPGLPNRSALATVVSWEGAYASIKNHDGDIYRVIIRGPVVDGPIITRRDIAFTLALF